MDKERRERETAQEEQLALELARREHEELRDEKMRQQIREQRCANTQEVQSVRMRCAARNINTCVYNFWQSLQNGVSTRETSLCSKCPFSTHNRHIAHTRLTN